MRFQEAKALPWSIVQTHPNAHRKVCDHLARQQFRFYNPLLAKRVVVRGKITHRPVQLFPNYVFVFVVDRWRSLLSTFGVAHLLMSASEQPAIISQEIIDSIKVKEVDDFVILKGQPLFLVGQRIKIKEGPFSGAPCIYDGMGPSCRSWVLLYWLGARRRMEIDESNLVAA